MTAEPEAPDDGTALHGPGLTDVRMMISIHRVFRRELALVPDSIRRTKDGDRARVAILADHLDLVLGGLHTHHTHEDDMMWPLLEERVPAELEPLVDLMEEQHEQVAVRGERVASLLAAWRSSAGTSDGAALATALDALVDSLVEHLDAEERRLLPIMARHIEPAEWAAFAKAGESATPKKYQLVLLGMMLYEGDPETMRTELAKAPFPARLIGPRLARRAYRRYAARVHGTPTPRPGSVLTAASLG